ncbi:hypothetical protein M5D96_007689 [Drosophila gunungcola]|uniref:Phosphoglycolate phosphatase n=1 Tax=Drosophila gunungcola TaxID=103775 RepID=A0A9P9YL52_9MUSC|nr:hypothetical protein M5D96_007689 [Drosophila gunungcola]
MNLALNRSVQKGGCQVLGLNRYSIQQWLKTIDTIIFDGDGVLWKNDEVLDKAPETFNALRAMGKEAYICSNSSKAQEMGFLVAKNEILSSSQTLARFMKQKKFKKKVYVVGGQGIIDELKLVGIESLPLDHPSLQGFSMPEHAHTIFLDPNVGAVVLTKACCYLKDPEVMFVATNRDSAFPSAPGRMIPRAGVMISAIQAASQRMPFTCGKPNPYMCIDLMRQGTIQPERTLIIGDTMNTDILFGYNCGFQTLMVGTGVSSYQDAIEAQASKVPLLYQQVPDLYQTCSDLTKLPKQRVRQWLSSFESVICDADGVLWHFAKDIEGAVETFNHLKSTGRNTFIVTNNSETSRKDVIEEESVLTSSYSCANFLATKKFQKKAFVMGEYGIHYELENLGICSAKVSETLERPIHEFVADLKLDPDVGAVVVVRAGTYLLNPSILFLGTCLDAAYPIGNNRVIVGAAATLAAVKAFTGRKPLVLGKPNPWMAAPLLHSGVIKPETTLMVGDTLETDIRFSANCKFQSLMVGSGVNSLKDVQKIVEEGDPKKMDLVPDTYLPSLGHLLEFLC